MNNATVKKFFAAFFAIFCLFALLIPLSQTSHPASADTGPKPSVRIAFINMGDELCYGTLLFCDPSTGPYTVWNGDPEYAFYDGFDYDVWKAFVDYEDSDGYYFLQAIWQCNQTKQLNWTYYPPSTFKILLYYPESRSFAVSDIYERYAFDSYYTVDMEGVEIGTVTAELSDVTKSYDYTWEIISLICRIVVTIMIELAVVLPFGLRGKKQLCTILAVNVVTQILLNVLLNVINFNQGYFAFIFFYILFELIVFAVEAVVYCFLLRRGAQKTPVWKCITYALVSNAASFAAGIALAVFIPGIF